MADRGRDLKIGILSDATKFDLSDPADQLDQVAEGASKSQDELKRLATQGQDAQRELDRLAKTGDKVDTAFDAIAKSSKRGLSKVDDDARKASAGMDELKDEANSTGKEAAASFGGVEDALDAVQEIAANAFAGFGPAGAAAGLLAAGGIGVLFSKLQAAADKANELKDKAIDLAGAISDAGGSLGKDEITTRLRDWSREIADNKSWWELWQKDNTTNIEKVAQQAEAAGLDFGTFFRGMSGDTADVAKAYEALNTRLAENAAARDRATTATLGNIGETNANLTALDLEKGKIEEARQALEDKTGVTEEANRLAALEQAALGKSAKAQQDYADDVRATRDAIAGVGQAALDSAADQIKSADDVIAAQRKALKEQQEFADNTSEVLREVGQEGVEWAESFGPLAPKMMKILADAPKKKQAEIIANYRAAGRTAGSATADGMESKSSEVAAAGLAVYQAAADAVAKQGGIKIDFKTGESNITYETRLALAKAQQYADNHPVTIKTKYAPSGQRPIRDVP